MREHGRMKIKLPMYENAVISSRRYLINGKRCDIMCICSLLKLSLSSVDIFLVFFIITNIDRLTIEALKGKRRYSYLQFYISKGAYFLR